MDLNTVEEVLHPRTRIDMPQPQFGDAYLAGGTWVFSEPQLRLRRLIDLTALDWPPLTHTETGMEIAGTCTLAALEAFDVPPDWKAAALFALCCRALVGSFKIRGQATVGGNICLALPAAPMVALAVALHAECMIWRADSATQLVPALQMIIGAQTTILQAGDVLRSLTMPKVMLRRRAAYRQVSLTPLGRSAALLIGTSSDDTVELTITASVAIPCRIILPLRCTAGERTDRIDAAVPVWYDDVHGRPAWRRHVTQLLAAEICEELA